jgi:GrpB-like predicted nucleotidyltransferase (UPF0157 family)
VPSGSALWIQRIAFRDALRKSATLATEYQTLKRRLANEYAQDREAYTEAKSPFIQSVLSRVGAGAAQHSLNPRPPAAGAVGPA